MDTYPIFRFKIILAACIFFFASAFCRNAAAEGPSESSGDQIEVRFQNDVEIFGPQAPIVLEIRPRSTTSENPPLDLSNEKTLNLHVAIFQVPAQIPAQPPVQLPELKNGETAPKRPPTVSAISELELQVPLHADNIRIPVSLLAPVEDGVYEIVISLIRKGDRANNSILGITGGIPGYAAFQRRTPKVLAEKTVQFVVVNPTMRPRPVGDLLSMKKELLETVDTNHPNWRKRLTQMPSLPKVGNLTSPLTAPLSSAKLPEIPKLGGFRERPLRGGNTTETEKTAEEEGSTDHAVPIPPGPLAELYEQWKSNNAGNIGSGHLKERQKVRIPGTGIPDFSTTPEPEMTFFSLAASETPEETPWEAMPLAVREIGKPHLLELDYPLPHSQELEINVVEMIEHEGRHIPAITIGSGIQVAEEIVSDVSPEALSTHRLLFWPKTKNPMLLLINRRHGGDALFGKVRLYRVEPPLQDSQTDKTDTSPQLPKPFEGKAQRLVAGYLHHSLVLEQLCPSMGNQSSGTAFQPKEWHNAFIGAERFVDLLHRCGYDGTMLTAISRKTELYPTAQFVSQTPAGLENTKIDDTKDGLELLCRLFDREQMTLIPAIDFDRPLRKIEDQLREKPLMVDELYWDRANQPPDVTRYNLLHPLVQEAMIEAVRELVERYASHPSFGGLAIQLTPEGYAQLPIIVRSVDDWTFQTFQREIPPESGVVFPPELLTPEMESPLPSEHLRQKSQRNSARAYFLQNDPKAWEAWLVWRTQKVRDFYARLGQIVSTAKPEAKLYLAGATMFDHPEIQQYCTPSLLHWPSVVHVLRMIGFDLSLLGEIPSLVFLRPSRITSPGDSYEQFDFPDLGIHFMQNGTLPGALLFHGNSDAPPTVPVGPRNRRRFVKQLAQSDTPLFFDGGNTLPCGSEDSLYDFLATFRRLPPILFQTYVTTQGNGSDTEKSLQPITVRFARHSGRLIVYLVNEAPFGVEAALSFTPTGSPLTELSGRRTVRPLQRQSSSSVWQVSLEAYDFLAISLDDPRVALQEVVVHRPAYFCGPDGQLRRQVDLLSERIRTAQQGIVWDKLVNPDFEKHDAGSADMDGWLPTETPTFTARIDTEIRYSGQNSMKLTGVQGIEKEPGTVWSRPFEAPITGRLFVSLCIGIAENTKDIPLNVVLSGRHGEQPWFRSFSVQPQLLPLITRSAPSSGIRWHRMIVPFDRLPNTPQGTVHLGFHLYGPGTIWIDEILLYRISFTPPEIKALQRLVLAAGARCSQNRVSDLLTILEGHWAQFLFTHVPEPSIDTSQAMAQTPAAALAAGHKPYAEKASNPSAIATPPKETETKKTNPGFFDRVKGFFGR